MKTNFLKHQRAAGRRPTSASMAFKILIASLLSLVMREREREAERGAGGACLTTDSIESATLSLEGIE